MVYCIVQSLTYSILYQLTINNKSSHGYNSREIPSHIVNIYNQENIPSIESKVMLPHKSINMKSPPRKIEIHRKKKLYESKGTSIMVAQDIGLFLRANTAITQMLSAYARRGQGLEILREILEKPIREMVAQTSLNLEINPVEVYKQIINSYESKMNKPWDGIRNPTSDEAAENKYVKRLIPPRKQLEYIEEHFIQRIIETVDNAPFGIRWICKQRFPEAARYQICGLAGGYIYLRFSNPVVTPESVHFVDKKVLKTMRRNLILVAKILQNLSNDVEFRDKCMHRLSKFIGKHREDIQTYFARLIDVDSLSDRMDVIIY